ncbi:hypothetical protein EG329_010481 [Mollisiaceae sp. DMI_Dod_QoI]|nr:hypothetical protein EG329_010481 [Helotiales sp. DMI_Dod_QoI]
MAASDITNDDPQFPINSSLLASSLPIHERSVSVDPQDNCPFFNGRIPPEIRDEIFSYALTESVKSNISSTYPENIARPGYTGKRTIAIPLLQTCRRIYLETYHLPVINREHVFWHAPERGPYGYRFPDLYSLEHENWYFSLMTAWQLQLVKEVHLFTQMFWLEGQFPLLCGKEYMNNVEKLKITLRRGDWWWNESNAPLYVHPKRRILSAREMLATMSLEKTKSPAHNGTMEEFRDSAWGSAFKQLESLKELEIEFETSDDKKAELEAIVEWAKTWKFPMKDGLVLSADGLDVKRMVWQASMSEWSHQCPYCGNPNRAPCATIVIPEQTTGETAGETTEEIRRQRPECIERTRRRARGEGPTLHVISVRWKLAQ